MTKKVNKQTDILLIHWQDAESLSSGWKTIGELEANIKEGFAGVDTVGFLLYENKELIVLGQNIGDRDVAEIIKIPKSLIKTRKKLGSLNNVVIKLNV